MANNSPTLFIKLFSEKFHREGITNSIYREFEIDSIEGFPQILKNNPSIKGLNVTIPYKQSVIPFLDEIDEIAQQIGAVNTIQISKEGKLKDLTLM